MSNYDYRDKHSNETQSINKSKKKLVISNE